MLVTPSEVKSQVTSIEFESILLTFRAVIVISTMNINCYLSTLISVNGIAYKCQVNLTKANT